MRKPDQRRQIFSKLPRNVEDELSQVHIEKIWQLLGQKFGFNVKAYKKDFYEYYQQQPHQVSQCEAFVEYGLKNINPLLNRILRRHEFHPTWTNLLEYIVGGKVSR